MRSSHLALFSFLLILAAAPGATAQRVALPYPGAQTPQAIDRGPLESQADASPISLTVALHLSNLDQAENLVKSLETPGDPQFRQFLTADQFVARFAPAQADVTKAISALAKYGLTAERSSTTTLTVTGSAAAIERAFGVSLHAFEVPAHENVPGYTYRAPVNSGTVPAELSGLVSGVAGLDTQPRFRPHNRTLTPKAARPASSAQKAGGNPPEFWTVQDMANYYDVNPLYQQGVSGQGRTVAIVTLAAFTPSDAFAYWSALKLAVNKNRLHIVNIDGGPGAPSDASGSLETTLDVEQSGGLAPGANIIVYQAPNTDQAFLDAFAAAVESNAADSISTSWGEWEFLDNLQYGPVTDAFSGKTVSFLQAAHELFLRGAIQGQSFFAAAGDGGAYDANDSFGCVGPYSPNSPTSCSNTLSVDYPGSDTLITAGGGTTIPDAIQFCTDLADFAYTSITSTCPPPYYKVKISHEQVWGWDYLTGYCATFGANPVQCGFFPVGGGGGVSVFSSVPSYQFFIYGTQLSQPGQVWQAGSTIVSQESAPPFYALPPFFPGRNVPDVSLNADPFTGYVIFYTSNATGTLAVYPDYGGTSFVGPQLNGITALLDQDVHSRVGLLNYPLYQLGQSGQAYEGRNAPLNAIAYGDNWFYHGSNGYNPGAGLGTIDVANFAAFLQGQH